MKLTTQERKQRASRRVSPRLQSEIAPNCSAKRTKGARLLTRLSFRERKDRGRQRVSNRLNELVASALITNIGDNKTAPWARLMARIDSASTRHPFRELTVGIADNWRNRQSHPTLRGDALMLGNRSAAHHALSGDHTCVCGDPAPHVNGQFTYCVRSSRRSLLIT